MGLIYFAAGTASLAVSNQNAIVTIVVFASEGFALAGVLLFGRIVIPGIFLGQLLLALHQGLHPFPAVGISIVNALEALIAWKLFHYFPFDLSLSRLKDLFKLYIMITFFLQPFSALLGTLTLYSASIIESHDYLQNLFAWWFGNTLGQMLWTPMLLLLFTMRKRVSWWQMGGYTLFFLLFSYLVFFQIHFINLSLLITVTLPLSVYIAVKKGTVFASVLIVILSIVSLYATFLNVGFFTSMSLLDNIINLNFYILSHILIVTGIGILYQEVSDTRESFKHLNLSLEQEIKHQVNELNRQNLLLSQQAKLASMGEMLGMIAHQWRQPLHVINSNIAVINMLSSQERCSDPLMQKKIESTKKQTRFMSETIEDFANFFRPDKRKTLFSPERTIHRALKLIGSQTEEIALEFRVEESTHVVAYENEYLQVLLTILHNAIENFHASGIKDPKIIFHIYHDEEDVVLEVRDNGGGIKQTPLQSIFNPYVTTNRTEKNSGLGLYMAKILVEESMQGRLFATNEHGGAVFTIILPKGDTHV
jgi:signal transduction histidine kinase